MKNDTLGTRIKAYEDDKRLVNCLPIYARVDGINFHRFCSDLRKPYDENLVSIMLELTDYLAKTFNVNCAYTQSDEISLAWLNDDINSEIYCGGKVQKFNSHLASKTSVKFNRLKEKYLPNKPDAFFDCRIFQLPNLTEATNTFLWRELDATRNSLQMAGRYYFSHKQLFEKNSAEINEMLFEKGVNWNNYENHFKRGTFFIKKRTLTKYNSEELQKLPPMHEARKNPDLLIERNIICKYDMPPLTKVTNRERVLFHGEEPNNG